jgi:NADPH-dependent 2,4-dienoyl-CoA reductase/sulfur reductase-like enzyme
MPPSEPCALIFDFDLIQMFQNARTLADNAQLTADVCIIGSGPAGLTLCQELGRAGFRILLVESGGMDFDAERQSLLRDGIG